MNKNIYLKSCLQKCQHFSPFVDSVDGLLGLEATVSLKRISSRLAKKPTQGRADTSRVGYHPFGVGHTSVHLGVQGAGTQNCFPAPPVGRRRQAQPLQVGAPRDPNTIGRPYSTQNTLSIPVQTALACTRIYKRPTASSQTQRKDCSDNRREPLRHTRGGRVHLPPLEYIEHKPSIIVIDSVARRHCSVKNHLNIIVS